MTTIPWWTSGSKIEHHHQCPVCGYVMDSVATVYVDGMGEPAQPKAGDLSICVGCWSIGVYEDNNTLRVASSEECEQVPDWVRARIAMRESEMMDRPS